MFSSSLTRPADGRLFNARFKEESSTLIDRDRDSKLAKRGFVFLTELYPSDSVPIFLNSDGWGSSFLSGESPSS
jgi:hypothetical protein